MINIYRLKFISKEENVNCDDEVLKTLVSTSGGDMRRAITSLQSCSRLKGPEVPILIDDVYEITGVCSSIFILQQSH